MLPSEYIQKGWCKGAIAKNQIGQGVLGASVVAVSWCALGAVNASYGSVTLTYLQASAIRSYLFDNVGNVGPWNDRQETSAPVIAMLQAAEREVLQEAA